MSPVRDQLVRLLAVIDQELALAEDMVTEPQNDDDLQAALELMLEFDDARRNVEAELAQLR